MLFMDSPLSIPIIQCIGQILSHTATDSLTEYRILTNIITILISGIFEPTLAISVFIDYTNNTDIAKPNDTGLHHRYNTK